MLARLSKVIFWFTLTVALIDFPTTMLSCTIVIGVGLGVLVCLAGRDYPLPPAQLGELAQPAIGATLMAQILPFIRRSSLFAPDVTLAMGEAYDKAIGTIYPDAESQFVARELIAKRIIRMVQTGVVDRDQRHPASFCLSVFDVC